jgi:uridine kinase
VTTQVVESFADLADLVRSRPPRLGPVRLVAVDGPSGAGKTRFAARLAAALEAAPLDAAALEAGGAAAHKAGPAPGSGAAGGGGAPRRVSVVHTDDLLDGWDDQFTFWARLEERVLGPLRAGRPAGYQRYLWHRRRFGGAPVTVPAAGVVIVEGVSAARAVIRPELTLSVFVSAPADLRWRRAMQRHVESPGAEAADRVALRAYLERWRAAEDRHFTEDSTAEAVDVLVDGAARPVVDMQEAARGPVDRYVRLIGRREES